MASVLLNIPDWAAVNVHRGTSVVLDLKPGCRCAATHLVNVFTPKCASPVDRLPVCVSWRTRTTKQPPVWRRWSIVATCCWRRSRVRWRTSPSRSSGPATERRARCRRGTPDAPPPPPVLALPVFTSQSVWRHQWRNPPTVKQPFTLFYRRVWRPNLWNIFLTVYTSVCETPPVYFVLPI